MAASPPARYTKEQCLADKNLLAEEYDELVASFDEMDEDHSGLLDMEEVVKMIMKESGVSKEEAEENAKRQLEAMDKDGDQKISFNEYVDFLT
eukprot:CAMPEP_0115875474 /NCGR_PEP_ID=MMETSP0287-20121206/25116_1 /TAXON_ID=412157 /ORGANISM="Chrysochromulina rotalis, Strain UIO044" /LENGTH=92 /DNA_ID=CAMNT_0003330739 /DNA_START=104 /DNA_END=382 /DNA_ORIENTATION=-